MLIPKFKGTVKRAARCAAPHLYERLRTSRHQRAKQRLDRITAALLERKMLEVLAGPFKGLQYTVEATAAHYSPKLTGAYESELHVIIEQVVAARYSTIIDVGCSEGYYAVGLAMRCPAAKVIAYDIDENSRNWCGQLAARNGVSDRVSVRRECTPDLLAEFAGERTFLLSDCEGFETELLDPARAPMLAGIDILVELHDCYDPLTTQAVLSRFTESHDVTMVYPAPRHTGYYPLLEFLSPSDAKFAISDLRSDRTHWAFMKAKRPAFPPLNA